MGVSVGRDFDIHLVETALLINPAQIRSRKSCGGADGLIDDSERNLAVLIKHHPTIRSNHDHLRDGSRLISSWVIGPQGFPALEGVGWERQ